MLSRSDRNSRLVGGEFPPRRLPTYIEDSRCKGMASRTLTMGGKYHCSADRLFDLIGFYRTRKCVVKIKKGEAIDID